MVKQRDEEQLKQLAEVLYSLPEDARVRLSELLVDYGIEAMQAEQLSLLPGVDEDDM